MSRFAYRHAVKDSGDTGSIICTVQAKGCWHRHGPEALVDQELSWGPCPSCVNEKSTNRVKVTPRIGDGTCKITRGNK